MSPDVDLAALLAYPGRATRALVDLDVLRENARRLKRMVGDGVELMAVVKADGYGHGAVMAAREALAGGATWLGVATVSEGIELRAASIDVPVLVLGPIDATEIDRAVSSGLDLTVGDSSLVEALVSREPPRKPRLHLKVDSGMHRYGLAPSEAPSVAARLQDHAPGRLFGICTHLAAADDDESDLTQRQLGAFHEVVDAVRAIEPGIVVHAANSAASVRGIPTSSGIVRVGIALYGCGVTAEHSARIGLRPAMSVVSRIARVHEIGAGDGVGYGHTYIADRPSRIGLVPIGYADGYPRSLGNRGRMTVDGASCPVRGRVCMDQTMIGDLDGDVRYGSWVGVAGPALVGPAWDVLAEQAGTIDYELLTGVGRRVARLYHRSGRLVVVRDELGRYEEVDDDNNAPDAIERPGREIYGLG